MTKTIVNSTMPIILESIEVMLTEYPANLYQQLFANPEIQQELIIYTLNQVRSRYVMVEDNDSIEIKNRSMLVSWEERLNIEEAIAQGIQRILQKTQHQPDISQKREMCSTASR